jgi:hypothetical protein
MVANSPWKRYAAKSEQRANYNAAVLVLHCSACRGAWRAPECSCRRNRAHAMRPYTNTKRASTQLSTRSLCIRLAEFNSRRSRCFCWQRFVVVVIGVRVGWHCAHHARIHVAHRGRCVVATATALCRVEQGGARCSETRHGKRQMRIATRQNV